MNSVIQNYLARVNLGYKIYKKLEDVLPLVLRKINNIKSTRLKMTPAQAVSKDRNLLYDIRKSTSRASNIQPKKRLEKGLYVRHVTAAGSFKGKFYKQYIGLKVGSKLGKSHWSRKIYKIGQVKHVGHAYKYKLSNMHGKWWYDEDLLVVPGPKAVRFKSPVKKKRKPRQKKGKKPAPPPRAASTRVRKKVKRYGYS